MEKLSVVEQRRRACLRSGDEDHTAVGKAYAEYVRKSQKQAASRLDEIAMEQAYEQLLLQMEQESSRSDSVNGIRRSTAASRRHAGRLLGLRKQVEAMAAIDPDAFYVLHSRQILQDINDERDGRLVKVPYLQRANSGLSCRTSWQRQDPACPGGKPGADAAPSADVPVAEKPACMA